ncbi:MAG: diphosphomevalonate decarboxylase, partial [Chloroflexota bacterium]
FDNDLRIPMNGSISMTLDAANTTTTVKFDKGIQDDRLILNERVADNRATARVSKQLDHIRKVADLDLKAEVRSQNSFPTGAGIASSASGFAALTLAAAGALGLDLTRAELGRLARLGSGSACRSIDGGFVEWQPGKNHEESYAAPIAPAAHWDLVDIVAIISNEHKAYGSSMGHTLAHSSPFYEARLETIEESLAKVRTAILEKDFATLGQLIEEEAIQLHVTAMTSTPSVLYWQAGTLNVIHALREWRRIDPAVAGYFTIDAGANVHIIAEREAVPTLIERLQMVDGVEETLVSSIGGDARLIGEAVV